VVPVYDVDALVGAGILTRDEATALVNDLDNLLGACPSCNSSKGKTLPGNIVGTWLPENPSQAAIDKMKQLGTWK
jgi:5-methylcytosine-specific restriction endonuclease McrA